MQIDLAERRLEGSRQRLAVLRVPPETGERELDVLARPQRVRGEVRARAEVVPGLAAADRDPIDVPALGVGDLELGEDRMTAAVLQEEPLLAAELAAQRRLPRLQRHPLWPMETRQLLGHDG